MRRSTTGVRPSRTERVHRRLGVHGDFRGSRWTCADAALLDERARSRGREGAHRVEWNSCDPYGSSTSRVSDRRPDSCSSDPHAMKRTASRNQRKVVYVPAKTTFRARCRGRRKAPERFLIHPHDVLAAEPAQLEVNLILERSERTVSATSQRPSASICCQSRVPGMNGDGELHAAQGSEHAKSIVCCISSGVSSGCPRRRTHRWRPTRLVARGVSQLLARILLANDIVRMRPSRFRRQPCVDAARALAQPEELRSHSRRADRSESTSPRAGCDE